MATISGSSYITMVLLNAVTTNTNGASFTLPFPAQHERSKEYTFMVFGTFGGGTAKLQASINGTSNWVDIPNTSFTADGIVNISCRIPFVRAVLSGATSPNLTAVLI